MKRAAVPAMQPARASRTTAERGFSACSSGGTDGTSETVAGSDAAAAAAAEAAEAEASAAAGAAPALAAGAVPAVAPRALVAPPFPPGAGAGAGSALAGGAAAAAACAARASAAATSAWKSRSSGPGLAPFTSRPTRTTDRCPAAPARSADSALMPECALAAAASPLACSCGCQPCMVASSGAGHAPATHSGAEDDTDA